MRCNIKVPLKDKREEDILFLRQLTRQTLYCPKKKTDTTFSVLFTPHTLNLKSASVWRHNRRLNLSFEFLHSYVNGTNIVLFRTFDCWYLLIPLAPFSVVWLIFKNFQALVFRKNQYKEWYAVASKFGNTLLICDQSMIFLFPVWLEKM